MARRQAHVLRAAALSVCVAVSAPSFAAPDLPIIAVTEIQASVDSRSWLDYKNSKAANFQNMLETQLVKVGRFKIVERNRVDEVLSEDALSGEVRKAENVEVAIASGNTTETRGLEVGTGAADPLADVQREAAKKVAANADETRTRRGADAPWRP